jgi:hypothetical protein
MAVLLTVGFDPHAAEAGCGRERSLVRNGAVPRRATLLNSVADTVTVRIHYEASACAVAVAGTPVHRDAVGAVWIGGGTVVSAFVAGFGAIGVGGVERQAGVTRVG